MAKNPIKLLARAAPSIWERGDGTCRRAGLTFARSEQVYRVDREMLARIEEDPSIEVLEVQSGRGRPRKP